MATRTWLKEGDVVEISIPPLGTLRSPVASPNVPPFPVEPVRLLHTSPGHLPDYDPQRVLIGSPKKALHVEVSGPDDGHPVLFIHGLGSSLQSFKAAVER